MDYVIQVLENDLRLINEGLRTWDNPNYPSEKIRQIRKAEQIEEAIKHLKQWQ